MHEEPVAAFTRVYSYASESVSWWKTNIPQISRREKLRLHARRAQTPPPTAQSARRRILLSADCRERPSLRLLLGVNKETSNFTIYFLWVICLAIGCFLSLSASFSLPDWSSDEDHCCRTEHIVMQSMLLYHTISFMVIFVGLIIFLKTSGCDSSYSMHYSPV